MDVQKKKMVRVLMESMKEETGQNVTLFRHRNYVVDDYNNCSNHLDHNLSSINRECLKIYRLIDVCSSRLPVPVHVNSDDVTFTRCLAT